MNCGAKPAARRQRLRGGNRVAAIEAQFLDGIIMVALHNGYRCFYTNPARMSSPASSQTPKQKGRGQTSLDPGRPARTRAVARDEGRTADPEIMLRPPPQDPHRAGRRRFAQETTNNVGEVESSMLSISTFVVGMVLDHADDQEIYVEQSIIHHRAPRPPTPR